MTIWTGGGGRDKPNALRKIYLPYIFWKKSCEESLKSICLKDKKLKTENSPQKFKNGGGVRWRAIFFYFFCKGVMNILDYTIIAHHTALTNQPDR